MRGCSQLERSLYSLSIGSSIFRRTFLNPFSKGHHLDRDIDLQEIRVLRKSLACGRAIQEVFEKRLRYGSWS